MLKIDVQTRMAMGAALASIAAVCIVVSLLLGWSAAPRPWGFLLGFLTGVASGLGATLAVTGLIGYRQGR
jgi:predicted ABC-type sugar transport system permease subunit